MEIMREISEVNKLIYRLMKNNGSFEELQLVSLMANGIIPQAEVENEIDLKALCKKHNVDYDKL